MGRIAIFSNYAWTLYNFRRNLISALVASGHEVHAIADKDEYASRLEVPFHHVRLDRSGLNPIRDLRTLLDAYRLFKTLKINLVLTFTIKPNVYGSLAARILGIPVINNVSGLGTMFLRGSLMALLGEKICELCFTRSRVVFFQNSDDMNMFLLRRIVSEKQAVVLPGSGIDLEKFAPEPLPGRSSVRFMLVARMLWDKGVGEFVAAARLLKQRGVDAEFFLLGFLDVQNPTAISRSQMDEWVGEGIVHYLGVSDNVRDEIAQADCVVLPSFYREGTPRTLLEGAAMARPIITTDSVGCRDVVDDGVNGYWCRPRDASDLAEKMARVAAMLPEEREVMGLRGREKVEREFGEQIVINRYLASVERVFQE